jgi:hypothetical protein
MKTGGVIIVILLLAGLYWVYEANPGNIFQRS